MNRKGYTDNKVMMLMMMMTIMLTRSREVESTSSELASALGKTVGHDDEDHHQ